MEYTYEVALSFAGEDRAFADAVAKGLRDAGVRVFYDDFYAGFVYEKNNGWPEIGVDMDYPSHQRSYYYNYYYDTMYLIDTYGGTDPGNLDVGNMLIHATVQIGGQLVKLSSDGSHSFTGDPQAVQQNRSATKVVIDGGGRENMIKKDTMKRPKRNH